MKSNISNLDIPLNFSSRELLLKVNAELIDNLRTRVNQKRFKPQVGDGIRLGYYRVLIQALACYNTVLKDTELDEFKKRLEALENSQNGLENNAYTSFSEVVE